MMLPALLAARPFMSSLVITGILLGLIGLGYVKGRSDGKIEQLKGSVEAYQERGDIDNETRNLGDYDLCLRVGGLPDQCDELRGLEQTTPAE